MKTLYRPVGLLELKLIWELQMQAFPPRLPEQPIFYPVLNKPYADQIAREWNTKDKFSGYVGFVTEFQVNSPYIDAYQEQTVGANMHKELWIPAEDLNEMNRHIIGDIKLVNAFYGLDYTGVLPVSIEFEQQAVFESFLSLVQKQYRINS